MSKTVKFGSIDDSKEAIRHVVRIAYRKMPLGKCDLCGRKRVKVATATNAEDPTQKKDMCMKCVLGGEMSKNFGGFVGNPGN